ncbi:hypothetical protein C8R42DRAFT_645879 [Lentinula raphanica]|nr:hypothetical protein C8R42DRAFT_645879 [Lentinula raphanica]
MPLASSFAHWVEHLQLTQRLSPPEFPIVMNEQTARLTDINLMPTPISTVVTGPEWPTRKGPEARHFVREARHIHRHPIQDSWLTTGANIYQTWTLFKSNGLHSTLLPMPMRERLRPSALSSFPSACAVKQYSLFYDAAVAAAEVVHKILADTGFPTIEVAFVESVITRSARLLSFDPILDDVPELRKPFTSTLGLAIAPRRYPNIGGTAALYYHLDQDTKRVVLLTCAHVAHPLSVSPNKNIHQQNHSVSGVSRDTPQILERFYHFQSAQRKFSTLRDLQRHSKYSQRLQTLSNGSFDAAIEALKKDIEAFSHSVPRWKSILARLGDPVEGEDSDVTASRKRHTLRVEDALERINKAKALHNELTQHHGTPDQRIIGSVLHSESTQVSVKLNGFSQDWALIEIDDSKIDWPHFKGNKIYIGGDLLPGCMVNFCYPEDGLLQAYGVVEDAEFRNPQHLDIHNENCLLVVRNGMKTGTTFGRVNGLESFTRCDYGDNNTHHTFIEFTVYRYDHNHPSFSEPGMGTSSGSSPAAQALLEITYITPYWWIEQQIKAKFPQSSFYEVVQ